MPFAAILARNVLSSKKLSPIRFHFICRKREAANAIACWLDAAPMAHLLRMPKKWKFAIQLKRREHTISNFWLFTFWLTRRWLRTAIFHFFPWFFRLRRNSHTRCVLGCELWGAARKNSSIFSQFVMSLTPSSPSCPVFALHENSATRWNIYFVYFRFLIAAESSSSHFFFAIPKRTEVRWRREKATKRFNFIFILNLKNIFLCFCTTCDRSIVIRCFLLAPKAKLASEFTFTARQKNVHHSAPNRSVFLLSQKNLQRSQCSIWSTSIEHAMRRIFWLPPRHIRERVHVASPFISSYTFHCCNRSVSIVPWRGLCCLRCAFFQQNE